MIRIQNNKYIRMDLRNAAKAANHPLVTPLIRVGLTVEHCGNVLKELLGLHLSLEQGFGKFLAPTEYSARKRSVLLANDLLRLGRLAELNSLPSTLFWSGRCLASPSEYVGMRYVIDGYPGDGDGQAFSRFAATQASLDPSAAAAIGLFADIEDLFDRHLETHGLEENCRGTSMRQRFCRPGSEEPTP